MLSFFLFRLNSFSLCRFLAITPYHNCTEEAADNSRADQDEDDWYAYRPDSGWEVGVERVIRVNERLKSQKLESVHQAEEVTHLCHHLPSTMSKLYNIKRLWLL